MPKIAIDVVLLPDESMTKLAIEVNKRQSKLNSKIVLDKAKCLPHISLAMGVIEEIDLTEVNRFLQKIASQFNVFKLTAMAYQVNKTYSGEVVAWFSVEKTPELQLLHEIVMNKLKPFLSYDASPKMILSHEPVDKGTLDWISKYAEKSSFSNFKPHITLGFGKLEKVNVKLPIDFVASTLAICHLGNHCTCRKVLFSSTCLAPKPKKASTSSF